MVVLGALAHKTPGIGVKQVSLWVEGVPRSLGTLSSKDIFDSSLESVIPCSPNATIRLFEIYLVEGLGGVLGIENVKLYGARGILPDPEDATAIEQIHAQGCEVL